MRRRHGSAGFDAIQTRFGARLAMVHRVLAAFVSAALADVSTKGTNRCCVLASAGHGGGGKGAHFGAVNIVGNAFRHHLHVFFQQAGGCAVVTGSSTGVARRNARLVGLVGHTIFLS